MIDEKCPDDCPHLQTRQRTDYTPPGREYWCGREQPEVWLGFYPAKTNDCKQLSKKEITGLAGVGPIR
jgi:hypothetical protein